MGLPQGIRTGPDSRGKYTYQAKCPKCGRQASRLIGVNIEGWVLRCNADGPFTAAPDPGTLQAAREAK